MSRLVAATETAERATLVLPACGPFEKTGTTTNMVGEQLTVEAGLEPPDGALSDLAMLVALADALGVTIPAPQAIERAAREALAAPARAGLVDASLFGEDDTASDPERLVFDGGGTAAFDERFAPLRSKHGAPVGAAT